MKWWGGMKTWRAVATGCALLIGLSACSGARDIASSEENGQPSPSPSAPASPPVSTQPPFPMGLDPENFGDSVDVDNPWWPLQPGRRWVWEGEATDGEERIERRVVFTVTDLVKEFGGIRFIVGYDLDYNDDVLLESELIFLAEDDEGNIWHVGQYTELWDEGALDGGLAWLAGYVEGASPGVLLPGDPSAGKEPYIQGFAPPPYFWDDVAEVARGVPEVCVEAGCYDDVVVIREFEPTKPGAAQLKYWARGVGVVKVGWEGDDEEQEEMELIATQMLEEVELAEVRELALAMETRARVFGRTPEPVRRG